MFKIATHPIMAGLILCALQAATGPPAAALDQWIELTNNTRMTIVEIYISHVGAQLWGHRSSGCRLLGASQFCIDKYKRCSRLPI